MSTTLEPILKSQPFLAGLEERHLALLSGCAKNVRFTHGEFLLREGEQADVFYILRSGKVNLEIFAPDIGPIAIETLGEGDVIGWSWMTPPFRWRMDARALELTRALALDGACLRAKCAENHSLGFELYGRFAHVIAQRLQATRLQLVQAVSDGYRR